MASIEAHKDLAHTDMRSFALHGAEHFREVGLCGYALCGLLVRMYSLIHGGYKATKSGLCQDSAPTRHTKNPPCGGLLGVAPTAYALCVRAVRALTVRCIFAKLFKCGAVEQTAQMTDGASQAGAAIGTALGAGMIITVWVVGDFILGLFVLFTRPKAV